MKAHIIRSIAAKYHRCPCGEQFPSAKALDWHQQSGRCEFVAAVRRHPARVVGR